MRGRVLFFFFLLFTFAATAGAQVRVRAASPEESKLIALENAWNLAQLHHDAGALEQLVGESFIYTDYDGTVMDKAKFLADVKDPDYRASLVANEDVKVYTYPHVAIVAGTYHTKGTYKNVSFEHYGRFTDTWIMLDGMWQCIASHTTLTHK